MNEETLNLGGIYTQVGLDTSGLELGEAKVKAIVAQIVVDLQSIGKSQFAAGLNAQLSPVAKALTRLSAQSAAVRSGLSAIKFDAGDIVSGVNKARTELQGLGKVTPHVTASFDASNIISGIKEAQTTLKELQHNPIKITGVMEASGVASAIGRASGKKPAENAGNKDKGKDDEAGKGFEGWFNKALTETSEFAEKVSKILELINNIRETFKKDDNKGEDCCCCNSNGAGGEKNQTHGHGVDVDIVPLSDESSPRMLPKGMPQNSISGPEGNIVQGELIDPAKNAVKALPENAMADAPEGLAGAEFGLADVFAPAAMALTAFNLAQLNDQATARQEKSDETNGFFGDDAFRFTPEQANKKFSVGQPRISDAKYIPLDPSHDLPREDFSKIQYNIDLALSHAHDSISKWISDTSKAFDDWGNGILLKIGTALAGIPIVIAAKAVGILASAEQLGVDLAEKIRNGLKQAKGNVLPSAEVLGQNIGKGLSSGCLSVGGLLINGAKKLAQIIIHTSEDTLNTHSPSKVMHQIGVNVGQGLADGIDASTANSTAAAQRHAQAVASAFRTTLESKLRADLSGGNAIGVAIDHAEIALTRQGLSPAQQSEIETNLNSQLINIDAANARKTAKADARKPSGSNPNGTAAGDGTTSASDMPVYGPNEIVAPYAPAADTSPDSSPSPFDDLGAKLDDLKMRQEATRTFSSAELQATQITPESLSQYISDLQGLYARVQGQPAVTPDQLKEQRDLLQEIVRQIGDANTAMDESIARLQAFGSLPQWSNTFLDWTQHAAGESSGSATTDALHEAFDPRPKNDNKKRVPLMSAFSHDFTGSLREKAFSGIGSIVDHGVDSGLGGVFHQLFGVGKTTGAKADGSQGNPYHVIVANAAAQAIAAGMPPDLANLNPSSLFAKPGGVLPLGAASGTNANGAAGPLGALSGIDKFFKKNGQTIGASAMAGGDLALAPGAGSLGPGLGLLGGASSDGASGHRFYTKPVRTAIAV